MEYRYSKAIDPTTYRADGLSCNIPLRENVHSAMEVKGALRAQKDWTELVAPVKGYHGGIGDRFSFMSVTVPECLPDRLEILSYANEFAFLFDDKMESFDLKGDLEAATGFLDTFNDDVSSDKTAPRATPEKRLQAQILSEMMAIDRPRAITTMKACSKFVQAASRTRLSPFETLAEYLPLCATDTGEVLWYGTLTFGMALTIPDDEYDLCVALARPCYIALGLVNDLYSWDKERVEASRAGQDYVFNAIWVIMKERSVTEEEAKDVCRREALKQITAYCRNVETARKDPTLSKDLRTYLEALLFSYSGNVTWSIYCPRYKVF